MFSIFSGACYLHCHTFLKNTCPFFETESWFYCVVNVTIPTDDASINQTFAIASLMFHSTSPHTSFAAGLYNINAKVHILFTGELDNFHTCADSQLHT
jgi:hypothetical protein